MSLLTVDSLTVRFGGLTAVNALFFSVRRGEIVSIIGPNGAGKTTVFNAITGVYQPTEGRVFIENELTHQTLSRSAVLLFLFFALSTAALGVVAVNAQTLWSEAIVAGYVFQQPFSWNDTIVRLMTTLRSLPWGLSLVPLLGGFLVGLVGSYSIWKQYQRTPELLASRGASRTFQNIRLCKEMTVVNNVLLAHPQTASASVVGALLALPQEQRARERALEESLSLLEFVGLRHTAHEAAGSLPYGHQRRIEIARAMARKPKIILLDEPAAGANPSEAQDLMELILRIRERGITVILIEHHMKVVMGISDSIIVLDYGNKIAEGTPSEIRANPRVIEAYLGKGHSEEGTR